MLGNSPNIGTSLNNPVASRTDFKPFTVSALTFVVVSAPSFVAGSAPDPLNKLPIGPSLKPSIENVSKPPAGPSAPAKNLAPLPKA